jgi:hypothetical protein
MHEAGSGIEILRGHQRHGQAHAQWTGTYEYTEKAILDDSGQYLRAREAEAMV